MTKKLTKLLLIFLAALCVSSGTYAAADYQDIWWDANQSGMGFFIGHQENRLGIGWFHYGSDGKAAYLLLSGDLVNGVVEGSLERSTGPQPGSDYNAGLVQRQYVGTATLTFHSDNSATLNYNYDGRNGMMALTRMTFAGASFSGNWAISETGANSGCTNSAMNVAWTNHGTMSFASSGNLQTSTYARADGSICTSTFSASRSGSLVTGSGTTSCSDGGQGSNNFSSRTIGTNYFINEYTQQSTNGNGCASVGTQVGVKQLSLPSTPASPPSLITPFVDSADIKSVTPFSAGSNSPWGWAHLGVDFMPASNNRPFRAVASGVVENIRLTSIAYTVISDIPVWQVSVTIKHDDIYSFTYAFETFSSNPEDGQAQLNMISVTKGQAVEQGQIIGYSYMPDPTKQVTLDFTFSKDQQLICPESYFSAEAQASILNLIHKDQPTWVFCF